MRRIRWLALVPVVAATLAACGGDTLALNPVARAATRTQDLGARFSLTGVVNKGAVKTTFTGTGVFVAEPNRARMRLSSSNPAEGTIDMVLDGYVVFIRSKTFQRMLPKGKRWLRIDYKKISKKLGIDLGELPASYPVSQLDQLRETSKSVERVGAQRMRGASTEHYRAILDPEKSPLPDSFVEKYEPRYGPVDVWVDAKNRVRRTKFSYSSKLPGGERFSQTVSADLYDFGTRVEIELPPEDEVADLEDLS